MSSAAVERACAMWRALLPADPNAPIDEIRVAYERFTADFPLPADAHIEEVDAGGVPALWVSTPDAATDGAVMHLHGGGFLIGSPRVYREMAVRLSRASDLRVLVIDYRLAPEHPFPAAVDDATQAYRWLLTQVSGPARIALSGDSAGGGLALSTLLSARDAGLPLPSAAALLSPWVDLEATGDTIASKADVDPIVSRDLLLNMAGAYLAGQDARAPLASPLHADLTDLPPLLIQVGTRETLLDDAIRIADRAKEAGVDVTLDVVEDMPHVFPLFASFLPEAQAGIERLGDFIKAHTSATEQPVSGRP
jgi:epsilon-lactone hydrolase